MSLDEERLAELIVEVERGRVSDLKEALDRSNRRVDQLTHNKQALVDAVYQAVEDSVQLLDLKPVKPPEAQSPTPSDEVAVLMAGDWQLHKLTPDYDGDVCEARIELLADKLIRITDIQRSDHPVRQCNLWLLGDMVEGELIFPGQAHQISSGLFRQIAVDGPRILGNLIRRLLSTFERVHVTGVIGNHGAIGGRSRRESHPETNADRMVYHIVQQLFEAAGEDRVTWNLPYIKDERAWYAVDQIGNYSCLLFHGNQVRGHSTFPWYGFAKKVLGWKALASNPRFPMPEFDDAACGHWHTPTSMYLNGVTVRVNGTTESYNTYAEEQLAAMGEPSQHLMFVHPERGIVTAEYLIHLGEA